MRQKTSRFSLTRAVLMGALSLSVSALVGCGIQSPTPLVPGADWEDTGAPVAAVGPGTVIAPGGGNVAARPAVVEGVASFRGETLAGYEVLVFNALTGETLVPAGALKTDASGHFRVEVTNLKVGDVLRVQVASGYAGLETLVYGDKVAGKKFFLLSAGSGVVVDEFSTLSARVMNGLVSAAQLLNAQAGSPILQRAESRLAAMRSQFDAAIAQNPNLANRVVEMTNAHTYGEQAEFIRILVDNMGMRSSVTEVVKDAIGDIITAAKNDSARTHLSASAFTNALRDILFVGTSLTGSADITGGTLTVTDHRNGSSQTFTFPQLKEAPATTTEETTSTPTDTTSGNTTSGDQPADTTSGTGNTGDQTAGDTTPPADTTPGDTTTPVDTGSQGGGDIVVTPVNNGNQGNNAPASNAADTNATEGSLNNGQGASNGGGSASTPNDNANQNATDGGAQNAQDASKNAGSSSNAPSLPTEVVTVIEQPAPLTPGNSQSSPPAANNGQSNAGGASSSPASPKGNKQK